jgi:hypothetical protein
LGEAFSISKEDARKYLLLEYAKEVEVWNLSTF